MGLTGVATLGVDPAHPDAQAVARAVSVLRSGELLIYPTDTLYALGGRALDGRASERVRRAKGREENKPLPLVCADPGQARSLTAAWPEAATRLAEAFWPGPLTIVLPAAASLPAEVTAGGPSIALRVPSVELVRRLCAETGPLVSTSANLSGQPAPLTCEEAVAAVGRAAALALDGGRGQPRPSTIVDLGQAEAVLVRAGAVEWDQVRRVLR